MRVWRQSTESSRSRHERERTPRASEVDDCLYLLPLALRPLYEVIELRPGRRGSHPPCSVVFEVALCAVELNGSASLGVHWDKSVVSINE